MTQYFFRFKFDGMELEEVNSDLANDRAALAEAIRTCGEIMRDEAATILPGQECWIEVGEAETEPLFRVRLIVESGKALGAVGGNQ